MKFLKLAAVMVAAVSSTKLETSAEMEAGLGTTTLEGQMNYMAQESKINGALKKNDVDSDNHLA